MTKQAMIGGAEIVWASGSNHGFIKMRRFDVVNEQTISGEWEYTPYGKELEAEISENKGLAIPPRNSDIEINMDAVAEAEAWANQMRNSLSR